MFNATIIGTITIKGEVRDLFEGPKGGKYYISAAGVEAYVQPERLAKDDVKYFTPDRIPSDGKSKLNVTDFSSKPQRFSAAGEKITLKGGKEKELLRGPYDGIFYVNERGSRTYVNRDRANRLLSSLDSVIFSETSTIDENLQVLPKSTSASSPAVAVEKEDSARRSAADIIRATFGPKEANSAFLASRLLACYRAEAATGTPSGEYTAVSEMPDAQCRVFKKKLKRRIHEWEAAVISETGQQEVLPSQKAPLISLYKLYKATKSQIESGGVEATGGDASTVGESSDVRRGSESSVRNSLRSDSSSHTAPAAPAHAVQPSFKSSAASSITSRSSNEQNTTSLAGNDPRLASIVSRLPHVDIKSSHIPAMAREELQAEKAQVRKVLYRFEKEVSDLLGFRPTDREHREPMVAVYHYYGELKVALGNIKDS